LASNPLVGGFGNPRADDATIIPWALTHGHVVFTHDLGFGTV
jgi:hypothetical protein